MGKYKELQKVKLFIGIITKFIEDLSLIKDVCERHFGNIDEICNPVPFTYTDYYIEEQGTPLYRVFYSFSNLIFPDELVVIKRWTNYVEEKLKGIKNWQVTRPFNLDPGYIALSQMVLATTKPYSHRIYLYGRIYAEVTLIYKSGSFTFLPWTYRDYKSEEYISFFNRLRGILNELTRKSSIDDDK